METIVKNKIVNQNESTCHNCIMHSKIPYIEINDDGICSDCVDWIDEKDIQHDPVKIAEYKAKMEAMFEKAKKNRKSYDAIVLYSGGKDSTKLIHMVTQEYKLKVLAFTMAYPISKQKALDNIRDASKAINFDTMIVSPNEDMYKRYMKYSIMNGHNYDLAEDAGCGACSFLFRWYSTRIAMDMQIPIILDGRDKWQHGEVLFSEGKNMKEKAIKGEKPFGKLHDLFDDALDGEYRGSIYDYNINDLKNKEFPSLIAPFTFMEFSTLDTLNAIEDMGLKKDNFETMLTNCDAVYLYDYIMLNRYNCTSYHRGYSHGIRQGIPTIKQLNIDDTNKVNSQQGLTKEQISIVLKEYKEVLFYIAKNSITKESITDNQRNAIIKMIPNSKEVYGKNSINIFVNRFLSLTEFADYFGFDLVNTSFAV